MSAATVAGPSSGKAPAVSKQATTPKDDDEMLDNDSGSESEAERSNTAAVEDLRRQTRAQARQIQSMVDLINQMTTHMAAQANAQMAMPAAAPIMAPKMATPEKYEGGRAELPAFLQTWTSTATSTTYPTTKTKSLRQTYT